MKQAVPVCISNVSLCPMFLVRRLKPIVVVGDVLPVCQVSCTSSVHCTWSEQLQRQQLGRSCKCTRPYVFSWCQKNFKLFMSIRYNGYMATTTTTFMCDELYFLCTLYLKPMSGTVGRSCRWCNKSLVLPVCVVRCTSSVHCTWSEQMNPVCGIEFLLYANPCTTCMCCEVYLLCTQFLVRTTESSVWDRVLFVRKPLYYLYVL